MGLLMRIQLFQYCCYQEMNYYAFQPNCYGPTMTAPNMIYAPSLTVPQPTQPKIEYLASILGQALRISVINYAVNFSTTTHPNPQSLPTTVEKSLKPKISNGQGEIVLEQEEKKQILKLVLDPKKENAPLNHKQIAQKIAVPSQIQLTDDELPSKQAVNPNTSESKKTSKKRRVSDNSNFTVIVPEVDQIQTAYVPVGSVQNQQLTLLRNNLLLRQVTDMGDFCRGRRDKRQIRMLAN